MAEYIEREWLYDQMNSTEQQFSLIDALEMVENFPASDVEPTRHAHWDGNRTSTPCGGHAPYFAMSREYYKSPFCHECGAKMDEVSE